MPVFQLSNRTPSQSQTNRKYPQAMPAMGDKLPRVHSFKGVKGNAGFGPSPRLRAVRVSSVNPHADIEEAEEGTEWSEADIQINDQFDAVLHESSAPEAVVQPGKPLNGAFGIPLEKLEAVGDSRSKFKSFYKEAIKWQLEKGDKLTENQYAVVTRRKATHSVRFQAWQARTGNKLQIPFNKFARVLRERTGFPRKRGGNYLTDKPKEELLTPGKQVINDYAAAAVAGTRAANQFPAVFAWPEVPDLSADTAPASDGLAGLAVVPSAIDAVFAGRAYASLCSEKEKAKHDLNYAKPAEEFTRKLHVATPQDAESFLKFMEAGDKVLAPTQESISIKTAALFRQIRTTGSAPVNAAVAGIEIANTVAAVVPGATTFVAPVTVGLGMVEIYEGRHELLRRVDQKAQAMLCKEKMNAVLDTASKDHPDYGLAKGLVACLNVQQDRLIRQARREKKFARTRIAKGGGAVGGAVGAAAAVGALAAFGALTAVTGGAAAVGAALVAAIGGGAMAARNDLRARAEHTSKWRQRMAQVVALETSREELQAKLSGTVEDTLIRFEQQEGEYLPEGHRFAGTHVLELEARNNEYVGLRILALKVRDMVQAGTYDENSPIVALVHAIGIDPLYLLAICKAAQPKKPEEQLDFIQSKLGLKLGIKLRMAGATQAPPHVSVFLRHFEVAWDKAFWKDKKGLVPHSTGLYSAIREELVALYPDSQAGMRAFESAIGSFLKNTQRLPQTEFTTLLKGFAEYVRQPRDRFDGLVNKERTAAKMKADNIKQAIEKEATDLAEELERFARMKQADAVMLTRA